MRYHTLRKMALIASTIFASTCFLLLVPMERVDYDKNTMQFWQKISSLQSALSLCRNEPEHAIKFDHYEKLQKAYQEKTIGHEFEPKVSNRTVDTDMVTMLTISLGKWRNNNSRSEECEMPITLGEYSKNERGKEMPSKDSWDKFYEQISSCYMFETNVSDARSTVDQLLQDMATMPIVQYRMMSHHDGTQIKIILEFANGKKAVMKPMRFNRHHEADPDRFYFANYERHNAEIAAFHLDRVLGIRKSVPTVGRVFNLTDMWHKADEKFKATFYTSPAKNVCFLGVCDDLCDFFHPICGNPELKEGSVQVYLPEFDDFPWVDIDSPYKRTYSMRHQVAEWEVDNEYCNRYLKTAIEYLTKKGRLLLSLIDTVILDFLTGNQDRHHLMEYNLFDGDGAYFILHDNGQAFGQPTLHDETILMPLSQCCVIHPSTLKTLLKFYEGSPSLSEALYKSMQDDPVTPILSPNHFDGIERRLEIILRTVLKCVTDAGDPEKVIMATFQADL